jgi:hypothetical protein
MRSDGTDWVVEVIEFGEWKVARQKGQKWKTVSMNHFGG